MEKISKRKIIACSLLAVFMFVAGFLLLQNETARLQVKEQEQCRIKLDAVREVILSADKMRDASRVSFEKHLESSLRFMTSTLALDITEEGYSGPTLFLDENAADGAVAEIRGDRIVWPEGVPEGFQEISPEDLRAGSQIALDIPDAENPEGGTKRMILLSGQIAGDYYYVDWTEEKEILADQYAFLKDESFLEVAEDTFGGSLLLVSMEDSTLPLINQSTSYPDAASAAELGFTVEAIAEQRKQVEVGGKLCLCTYELINGGAATLIYVKPAGDMILRSVLHTGMGMITALIILATITAYIYSVVNYVRTRKLSRQLISRYRPRTFRRIILMAGITGALIVFVNAAVFETLDALHQESIIGAKSINRLYEFLQDSVTERFAYDDRNEAEWNVYQGKRIAALISRHPEAGTREKLQEYCDIFGIDYIMLFDSDGRETVSNSDYSGFTMDAGLGENSSDFRRLLMGVPYIVHQASTDPMTGLNRLMTGVTMPSVSGSGSTPHGALIMAVEPKQIRTASETITRQLQFLDNSDRICLFTDKEKGEILWSSDESMTGMTVMECGLPERSMQNGYTDFAIVRGISSYVTMVRQKNVNFFYIIASTTLFSSTLPAACGAVIVYALIFLFIFFYCLKGYNSESFKKAVKTNADTSAEISQETADASEERSVRNYAELLISSSRSDDRWANMTPERQAGLIIKLDILMLVILPTVLFLSGREDAFGGGTLLNFILFGDWMRGFNMFSFCGIIIVLTLGFLIIVLGNLILSLFAGFTGRGGETICRLLYSLVRYVAALTILYYVFEYIGLSMSTYVASLGMVSLALSLGSREMVSDIVAGIMILFERQFQVGDYVELDGSRGRVLEMGVRSTKLLTASNDIKFISNSGIRSVVNKSKSYSSYSTELMIMTGETIEAIEEKFRAALPEIGRKNRKIIGDLTLAGINRVSGGGKPDRDKTVSIRIRCDCKESDMDAVRDFVNREIYLFCERENIEIR